MNSPTPAPTSPSEAKEDRTTAASLGHSAARGVAYVTAATLVGRSASLIAQLVLGWLLSQQDYGLYGLAIGVSLFVLQLRTIGTDRILIQRGSEFAQLASPVARLTLLMNLGAAGMLAAAAPAAARFYGEPQLRNLIWVIAASLPLGVPAQIMRAKLSLSLQFRPLAMANAMSFCLRHAMVVLLALWGFGPFSFAWPMVAISLIDTWILRRLAGWWPAGRPLDRTLLRELLRASKWIIVCGFASTLVTQGSVLVLGKMENRIITGLFFFGFQLTISVADFFKSSMYSVLLPTFTRLVDDRRRQGAAFVRSAETLALLLSPVCLGISVAGPMLIHLLWQGKWDAAAPVVTWLCAALPVYLVFNLGGALLEARGMWRANAWVHIANAALTVAVAAIACYFGGLVETAIATALFRVVAGLWQGVFVCRLLGQSANRFLRRVLPAWITSCACAIFAVQVGQRLPLEGPWHSGGAATGIFLMLIGPILLFFWRDPLRQASGLLRGRGNKDAPRLATEASTSERTLR